MEGLCKLQSALEMQGNSSHMMTGQHYDQRLPSNRVSITLLCKCHFALECKTLHWPLLALTLLVWALRRESPAPPGWLSRPPGGVVTERIVYELTPSDLGLTSDQLYKPGHFLGFRVFGCKAGPAIL